MCVSRVRLRAEITRPGRRLLGVARVDLSRRRVRELSWLWLLRDCEGGNRKAFARREFGGGGCVVHPRGSNRGRIIRARSGNIRNIWHDYVGQARRSRLDAYGIILRPWVKRELFVITRGRINSNFADIFYRPHAWRIKLISFVEILRFSTPVVSPRDRRKNYSNSIPARLWFLNPDQCWRYQGSIRFFATVFISFYLSSLSISSSVYIDNFLHKLQD